ncbi:MAG: hypothetical protein E7633_09810 [Ruminococcaceae bacterium]|nr:hypothetical protein [Oscillospiraceae bacterium]
MNGNIGNMGDTGDMGSMIAKMLEDPEALGKVMSLAGTLSSSGLLSGLSFGESDVNKNETEKKTFEESGNASVENSEQEGRKTNQNKFVEESVTKNHTASHRKVKSSDRIRLLEAMRPFLSDEKRDKLDVVIKILGLADAAGGLYRGK